MRAVSVFFVHYMHNVFRQRELESERSQSLQRLRVEKLRLQRCAVQREELGRTAVLRASDWAQQHLDESLANSER